jgi:D-2-hydroxyglutarate dehydrogenase
MMRGTLRAAVRHFLHHQHHQQLRAAAVASFSSPPPPTQPRGAYAVASADDLASFREIVGESGVLTDAHDLQPLNRDWMGRWEGASEVAVRPRSADEVSRVLAHCNARRLAVVPQGGNTGLVGGSIPVHDEVVLSLSKMDRVLAFDDESGVLTCEAGAVLQSLDDYLGERGFMMPLDLGAKGSCQIGGNASTNAGGLRYIRYGSLHGSILGLEAVLADGTVVDCLNTLRKDNTGYDLKQLFIGAEGTLGVVTKLAILVPRRPAAQHVALLGVASFADVRRVFSAARIALGEILSAVEFADARAMEVVLEHGPGVGQTAGSGSTAGSTGSNKRNALPLAEPHPFYVLLETSGSDAAHDAEKLERFLEASLLAEDMNGSSGSTTSSSGGGSGGSGGNVAPLVRDGVLAADLGQAEALWALREQIGPACGNAGLVYKYDVSLPLPLMYDLVEAVRERLPEGKHPSGAVVVGYGHLGDSNLHLNVSVPGGHDAEVLALLEPFVFDWVHARRGSISAEHGVGQCKFAYLPKTKPAPVMDLMRRTKALFDPNGILNPYKVL